MKLKVTSGDLLYAAKSETFGLVYKLTPKKIHYYALGENGIGGPYKVGKEYLYEKIDDGSCEHILGKTKHRRGRNKNDYA
tara:strand:- start:501 stop:740 length:240 start_codon:yes stop_codon:yes gene_type:complete